MRPTVPTFELLGFDAESAGSRRDPREFLGHLANHVTPDMLLADRPAQAWLDYLLDSRFYHGPRVVDAAMLGTWPGKSQIDNETDLGRVPNHAPRMSLHFEDTATGVRGGSTVYDSFRLAEPIRDQHRYFFSTGRPVTEVPAYLRPEDVVPSGRRTIHFAEEKLKRMERELGLSRDQCQAFIYENNPVIARYADYPDIPFNKPLERAAVTGGPAERFNYNTGAWEPSGSTYHLGRFETLSRHLGRALHVRAVGAHPKIAAAIVPK